MSKTRSAVKKRFKLMGSGILKSTQSGKRHCMRKRKSRVIRDNRGFKVINTSEIRRMARGLCVGATKIKRKSNNTLSKEYFKNICKMKTIDGLLAEEMVAEAEVSKVASKKTAAGVSEVNNVQG